MLLLQSHNSTNTDTDPPTLLPQPLAKSPMNGLTDPIRSNPGTSHVPEHVCALCPGASATQVLDRRNGRADECGNRALKRTQIDGGSRGARPTLWGIRTMRTGFCPISIQAAHITPP